MPVTKSATRAHRRSLRRRAVNLRIKKRYKRALKEVRVLTKVSESKSSTKVSSQSQKKKKGLGGKQAGLTEKLTKAYSELDKAARTGVIHKNKAARLKSRLAKVVVDQEPGI